jgi:choline-sulfatase
MLCRDRACSGSKGRQGAGEHMTDKPNILILMVDQLTGTLFPDGPTEWLHAPNLKALAARSLRFANAYTGSPLCAPGRASFMTGCLPRRTAVYDNAAEFASGIPTFAHHLRRAGYQTTLSGKMHFVGPDQLHGFEERLTTDIYPADFGWTPDYRKPGERIDWWYHNLGSVTGAGVAEITNQLEYDDDVAHQTTQKLYDLSRGGDSRPWCLAVSFTHPHDPYVARRKYWDLYEDCAHLLPESDAVAYADQDPHSQRLMDACDWQSLPITEDHIRRARRGYFANISYIDDKIGEILAVLEATRQEAVVVFLSDHGDMLGERGLWFKMSFREGSARVPLMIAAPGVVPHCDTRAVSTIDVAPTLCELAGIDISGIEPWVDGASLTPLFDPRGLRIDPVRVEYAAEGSVSPMVCLVDGGWKYTRCNADPEQFFHLASDPQERRNLLALPDLSGVEDAADVLEDMRRQADRYWDLAAYDAEVRESQARRWVVYEALRNGNYYPWDFQPLRAASERYMRNHMDLNVLEDSKRFPRGE